MNQLELWDAVLEPQEPPSEVAFAAGWLGEPCPDIRLSDRRASDVRATVAAYYTEGKAARRRYEDIRLAKVRGVA